MNVTLILIIITVFISWQAFNKTEVFNQFMHYPVVENRNREFHRWLTSVFLHGDWMHLGINMFVLYGFGSQVEDRFVGLFGEVMGRINYLLLYLLAGVFANVPTFFKHRNNGGFRSVGASGAVSGIMLSSVLFNPWAQWYIYGILPLNALLASVLFLIYSSWAGKRSHDNIDHMAHFWGAIFGFVFTVALKPSVFTDFLSELMDRL